MAISINNLSPKHHATIALSLENRREFFQNQIKDCKNNISWMKHEEHIKSIEKCIAYWEQEIAYLNEAIAFIEQQTKYN